MDVYYRSSIVYIVLYFSLIHDVFSSLKDVTSNVGLGGNTHGVLAAFGDFNSDKKADFFMISNSKRAVLLDKSRVEVYLWDTSEEEFQKATEATIELEKSIISNVIPGDFNGDGQLDVLVAYHNLTLQSNKDHTFVKVYIGRNSQFEPEEIDLQDTLKDQPGIVDFDGDLHPDLLGEKTDGKRYWWKYNNKNNSFESNLISTEKLSPLSKPHSCGFLDLNGDYTPDLFIPTSKGGSSPSTKFEVWINEEGVFNPPDDSDIYERKGTVVGQSTFADLDSDGLADHVLPVCAEGDCRKSELQVYSKDKKTWVTILTSEKGEGFKWRFIKETKKDSIPFMTLRIGDYNLDGFPDAAVVIEIQLAEGQKYKRKVVLLENVECNSGSMACYRGRKFNMIWDDHALFSIEDPLVVGFIDIYDNGILDLLIASSNGTEGIYEFHAIKNNVYSDTCFLKVMVLGGSCYSSCPSGVTPFGVNQAGPYVKYITTGPTGDTKQASATQLSQAAYFALQPPYIVFGLGRTPNFVERLIIGLPRSTKSPVRRHTWTSIIPNSQVIIIPYPPDEPDEWKSKLLMTPSRLVFLTGGALLATCVFIGAIVALLHWKEKREDRREKQEAAHKFHFDAM